MKLNEINWAPSRRQLQQFGVLCLIILPLLGWIWRLGVNVNIALGVAGLLLAILGFMAPTALKPIFVGMQIIATPLGIVLGEAAMLLIFWGVFLPIGLVFRIVRRDALKKSFDGSAESYWEAKQPQADVTRYYRQS